MQINKLVVKNFRLLQDVELCLHKETTVIVGRNNSGKTSLTELLRRLTRDDAPQFQLEDFSLAVHGAFWDAAQLKWSGASSQEVRAALPTIEVQLCVEYQKDESLGPLRHFIIDLNPDCTSTLINVSYELEDGKLDDLFGNIPPERLPFYKEIKERIPLHYELKVEAEDPNDASNRMPVKSSPLRSLLKFDFINAQRALDDTSRAERAVLGRVLEALFLSATKDDATPGDRDTAEKLKTAVSTVQDDLDTDFNKQLKKLIPAFTLFGYPGLTDPRLRTETILKVESLLSNHTTVGYEGANGVNLPESYNGLGPRNLIFILLKLFEFFRSFTSTQPAAGVCLVFIEEPEAHLHPQMQSVFIRKLTEIASLFGGEYNNGVPWPVQFVVTTHSSHIANEAAFDSMRYFLAQQTDSPAKSPSTLVRDLCSGLATEEKDNRKFLHKYMTLTRCDLLFADKAILVEGTTERVLLPVMINKLDEELGEAQKLGSQYLSVMEVGGAYSHIFFNLLDVLQLPTLVITDLDTVDGDNGNTKCKVSAGTHSSNASIKRWYSPDGTQSLTKDQLVAKTSAEKVCKTRRLAFQIPHSDGDACGRSFEDAFMLANPDKFGITGKAAAEREDQAWTEAAGTDKTTFALRHAIESTDWQTPLYIEEGLRWLAEPLEASPAVESDVGETTTPEGADA